MRLFVAVNLDPAERERLRGATALLREAGLPVRWAAPETLHLTMKFLGEVDEAGVAEIGRAVERAASGVAPFEARLGGVGAFPSVERPRVAWVGVEKRPELMRLQRELERELAPLGYAPEDRPFTPHVTLGRAARDARPRDMEPLAGLAAAVEYESSLEVRTLDLMRSHTGPRGARYERLLAAPLGSGGA